jgi:hypothetical protein
MAAQNDGSKFEPMKKQTYIAGVVVIAGLGLGLLAGCATRSHSLGSSPITVYVLPSAGIGTVNPCPGYFVGCAKYAPAPPAFGWTPTPGATTFTASNGGGRSDVKIQFTGEFGDSGCNSSIVTIPNPPPSPSYGFAVYFCSNSVPTTNYPIILTGFNTN